MSAGADMSSHGAHPPALRRCFLASVWKCRPTADENGIFVPVNWPVVHLLRAGVASFWMAAGCDLRDTLDSLYVLAPLLRQDHDFTLYVPTDLMRVGYTFHFKFQICQLSLNVNFTKILYSTSCEWIAPWNLSKYYQWILNIFVLHSWIRESSGTNPRSWQQQMVNIYYFPYAVPASLERERI